MGNTDTGRIQTYEQENTFISPSLDGLIKEIDARLIGANCFITINRTDDLISSIDYFADIAKTQKRIEQTFSRITGSDGVKYITQVLTIFYNEDTTEDSRVATILTRDSDNRITDCSSSFSSSESIC